MPDSDIDSVEVVTTLPALAFNHQNPKLWFATIESQFACRNVRKQSTKFHLVNSMLPVDIQQEVEQIILNPPDDNPYDALKAAILGLLRVSDDQRLRQLFEGENLGDRKPSQLLTAMRRAGNGFNFDDKVLRTIWLRKLPLIAQQILSPLPEDTPLSVLATSADAICDLGDSRQRVSAVERPPDVLQQMMAKIEFLTAEVNRLSVDSRQRGRSTSRSRDFRRGSRSRSSSPGVCWYHRRYGKDARKCTSPCTYGSAPGNGTGTR